MNSVAQFLGKESKKFKESVREILEVDSQLQDQFASMDKNMKAVLEKHEYEFMQAYNIYVQKKEKELIEII